MIAIAETAFRASEARKVDDSRFDCPNCLSPGMQILFRAGEVPAHSSLMLSDFEEARKFPRRPMDLAFCESCGFVSNVAFDPTVLEYSDRYEDQQSASGRFREFQTGLVDRLIDTYDLRGKSVVEIGCGHADFLIELCRRGGNRGVGIDPRAPAACSNADVRFIHKMFSPKHYSIPCDLLCCRHTLDHVPAPNALFSQFRDYLLDKPQAILLVDMPDARRVWREVAFWDLYYEHCSYFTEESLACLIRRNGFTILELDRVFDQQYLLAVACTAKRDASFEPPGTGACRSLRDVLLEFSRRVPERILRWRERLARLVAEGRRAAIWGGSSKCTSFLSAVDCPEAIACIVDINPRQHGKYLPGIARQVAPPERLRAERPDLVLAMNPAYKDEICRDLHCMGVEAEVVTP